MAVFFTFYGLTLLKRKITAKVAPHANPAMQGVGIIHSYLVVQTGGVGDVTRYKIRDCKVLGKCYAPSLAVC